MPGYQRKLQCSSISFCNLVVHLYIVPFACFEGQWMLYVLSACISNLLRYGTCLTAKAFSHASAGTECGGAHRVNTGQDEDAFSKDFAGFLRNLQSHCRFSMDECFLQNLPREEPRNEREKGMVQLVLSQAQAEPRLLVSFYICILVGLWT